MTKQVRIVLRHLEGCKDEVPGRANCATTATVESIAHYIEGEIREVAGETRGCLGWPSLRVKKVSGRLQGLHNTVEAVRKK